MAKQEMRKRGFREDVINQATDSMIPMIRRFLKREKCTASFMRDSKKLPMLRGKRLLQPEDCLS